MIEHIRVSPSTHAAIRTLVGRAVERIFVTGEIRVVRRLREDARRLEVRSPDGHRYSGVLIVHNNFVTTGCVVPTPSESASVGVVPAGLITGDDGDRIAGEGCVHLPDPQGPHATGLATPETDDGLSATQVAE